MPSYDEMFKLKPGKKYTRMQQYATLDPNQLKLLSHLARRPNVNLPQTARTPLYQQGGTYLQGLLSQDPEMMKQFEAPYMRQFQEEIVPGVAERFSGVGAQGSSAFQQTMGQAGAGLAERLAALRGGLGLQAAQQALGYAQLPFQEAYLGEGLNLSRAQLALGTRPFDYMQIAAEGKQPSFWQSMMPGLASGIGKSMAPGIGSALGSAAGSFLGPIGTAVGGGLGRFVGGLFS